MDWTRTPDGDVRAAARKRRAHRHDRDAPARDAGTGEAQRSACALHRPTAVPCIHIFTSAVRTGRGPRCRRPASTQGQLIAFFRYSQDQAFSLLRSNRGFVAAMAAGFVTSLVIGGLLLSVIPGIVLVPRLARSATLTAAEVYAVR